MDPALVSLLKIRCSPYGVGGLFTAYLRLVSAVMKHP